MKGGHPAKVASSATEPPIKSSRECLNLIPGTRDSARSIVAPRFTHLLPSSLNIYPCQMTHSYYWLLTTVSRVSPVLKSADGEQEEGLLAGWRSHNLAMLRSRLLTRHREHFHRQIERFHERQTRELDMTVPCKSTCMIFLMFQNSFCKNILLYRVDRRFYGSHRLSRYESEKEIERQMAGSNLVDNKYLFKIFAIAKFCVISEMIKRRPILLANRICDIVLTYFILYILIDDNSVLRIAETHKNARNAPHYVYQAVSLAILVKRRLGSNFRINDEPWPTVEVCFLSSAEKLVLQYEQEEKVIRTGSLLPDFQFPDHRTATRVTTDCVYEGKNGEY
ncbi:hypothetical protein EAG_09744 [Camponotus floridanus]|uniref:Uncharacterized protein n=1 Tax=Camponotus floridanus TaxID=104421 RepID=E1ZVQ1_CAMFO|nr:hypothetical protein EAG_09744 [Camponotus floridanus]